MAKKAARWIFLAIVLLGAFAGFVYSQEFKAIETFSKYSVEIELFDSGNATVTHSITIKNNDEKNPIVPGIAYLDIFNNERGNMKIKNVTTKLGDGSSVVNFVREKGDGTYEIRYELWFPLRPNETREVQIKYDVQNFYFEESSFPTISFPIGDSSIPIEKAKIIIKPKGKNVTYAPNAKIEKNKLIWSLGAIDAGNVKKIEFEFSSYPLPLSPIKGAYIFWGIITFVLLAIIAIATIVLRKIKKNKQ